jgi:hypothetical protein
MTYNKTTKVWTVTLNLSANSLKFSYQYVGFKLDTGANGSLEFNGENIKVPSGKLQ